MPTGLSLDGNVISGTPGAVGEYTFTIMVTDFYGVSDTQVFTLVIEPQPLEITTTALAGGTLGEFYSQTLLASGGMPNSSYTWSLVSGSLPKGLNLIGDEIIGTPRGGGANTYSFTVKVTDSFVTAQQLLSIDIIKP